MAVAKRRREYSKKVAKKQSQPRAHPREDYGTAAASEAVTNSVTLPPWKKMGRMAGLLALVTAALYSPVLMHPFVNYDDGSYVVLNSHVNSGLRWQNIKWALTGVAVGMWHPVTWISHQLDCQLFGPNAGGHHATSLLLHILNVVLLFFLLSRVTGAIGRSGLVAALFALHPLNVQSVAWVAERKNLLCTLFFLLALGAYGWYAQKPEIKRYLAVMALFVLGLASKPMVITFPFVLLLLDFWPLQRVQGWGGPSTAFPVQQAPISKLVLEKLPLFALSCASGVMTVVAQRSAEAIPSSSAWTLQWRLENSLYGYATYLWTALFPQGLAPFYPAAYLTFGQMGLAAGVLVAVTVLVWKFHSGRPYLVSGYLWFLGTLVPVIGIIQVGAQSRADRYAYIPLIGVFIAVVWLLSDLGDSKGIAVRSRIEAAAVVLAVLSVITWQQVAYWRSSADLWTHALQVTQSNFIAEANLGATLADMGQEDEAFKHFENAVRFRPDDALSLLNVGTGLVKRGRLQEASERFQTVIRISKDPDRLASAYRGLGVVSDISGDRITARKDFLRAMQLSPNSSADFYNLSLLESEDGAEKLSQEVVLHPTADNYVQLGRMLEAIRKFADAQQAYQKALKLNPNLREAQQALQNLKSLPDRVAP